MAKDVVALFFFVNEFDGIDELRIEINLSEDFSDARYTGIACTSSDPIIAERARDLN